MDKTNSQGQGKPKIQVIARNRKGRYDYEILDTYEAGVSLTGAEVKSLRLGKLTIQDAYATLNGNIVKLKNLHITPYEMARGEPPDPLRERQLLLHKREIRKISKSITEKGLTLIPLAFYFKNGLVKVELAVARGRRKYDKRDAIAKRDSEREMKRALKRSKND